MDDVFRRQQSALAGQTHARAVALRSGMFEYVRVCSGMFGYVRSGMFGYVRAVAVRSGMFGLWPYVR
eukprot:1193024-Prorocentrum_minimum.AAC.1